MIDPWKEQEGLRMPPIPRVIRPKTDSSGWGQDGVIPSASATGCSFLDKGDFGLRSRYPQIRDSVLIAVLEAEGNGQGQSQEEDEGRRWEGENMER